jgi:hypothetical protein
MYSICIKQKQYIGDKLLNDTTGNLQDMRGFLNVNFQNGILNIYQRILIETKMKQLLI